MSNFLLEASILDRAKKQGIEAILKTILNTITKPFNNQLDINAINNLSSDQLTLWGYIIFREEIMNGGFIQLIYNGYGSFFFDNPFAKAMRIWGLKDLSKLIYKAKKFYDIEKDYIYKERTDEEFMALFEELSHYDDLDDSFIENEEEYTSKIVDYILSHIDDFVSIKE